MFGTRRGSLMLMVLVFMIALSGLATAFLFSVNNAGKITAGQVNNQKAFYLAEAGLQRAKWYLLHTAPDGSTNTLWRTSEYPAVAGVDPTDPQAETLDGGIYTMWVRDYAIDGSIYLTASSTLNEVKRTLYQRVKTGPLLWLKFDDGSGATAADSSGNGSAGTLIDGPVWSAGKVGTGALSFDGFSSYVSLPVMANPAGAVSFAAWVYPTGCDHTTDSSIVGSETWDGSGKIMMSLRQDWNINDVAGTLPSVNGDCYLFSDIYAGDPSRPEGMHGTRIVSLNQWQHVAGVFDKVGKKVYFYLNGTLDAEVPYDFSGTATLDFSNLNIGKFLDRLFAGNIDDVRVYSRVLSADEVAQLYADGDLVGHLEFDEGSGTAVADSSGNGNAGSLVNGAAWTTGKVNGAVSFDGSDDHVLMDPISVTSVNDWTLAAWLKPSILPQASIAVFHGYEDGGAGNGWGFGIGEGDADTEGAKLIGIFSGLEWLYAGYTFDSVDVWHHVVMKRSSSTTSFFVDGVQTATIANTDPRPPTGFRVGSQIDTRYWKGLVDDVRVYNRALSADEIARLYAGDTTESVNRRLSIVPGSWGEK